MDLGQALRSVLARNRTTVVHECRHCGRTLSAGADECPHCEWGGVARYRIPR